MVTTAQNPGTIGLISDTHGLLRPQALRALEGSNLIIHAGDVGNPEILEALKTVAPVFAVRGNVDTERWAREKNPPAPHNFGPRRDQELKTIFSSRAELP